MGIQVEFNPDLALRNIREYKEGRRTLEVFNLIICLHFLY
jgi:hypothetical protein